MSLTHLNQRFIQPILDYLTDKILPILLISAIIFFEPQSFKETTFSYLDDIDLIYKFLKLTISVLLLILYFRTKRPSVVFKLMCLFQTVCLFSTLLTSGNITRFFGPAITTIDMIIVGELLVHQSLTKRFARKIIIYFRVLFAINLITYIVLQIDPSIPMLPFLGIDNRWIFSYLPWILFEFYADNSKHKVRFIIVTILAELTLLITWSVAAMLLLPLVLFAIFLPSKTIANRTCLIAFLGIILANISFILIKVQNFFSAFLLSIKKDITLSGRTMLWDHILDASPKQWLIGHGMQSPDYDRNFFGNSANPPLRHLYVTHAHNSSMNVLYRHGIIALLLYIATVACTFYNISKLKNNHATILLAIFVICLLLGIFDTIDCACFYLIMGLSMPKELKS